MIQPRPGGKERPKAQKPPRPVAPEARIKGALAPAPKQAREGNFHTAPQAPQKVEAVGKWTVSSRPASWGVSTAPMGPGYTEP
jgi:hypothetical protein